MSYAVEITQQADSDLRCIFEYIAFELQAVQNATGQLSRLEKNILSLDEMLERYRRYGKEPWLSRGLRIMPVDNYCVFYIPDSEKQVVSIVCVMYGGRNIDAELMAT
ncbi:MAG: type II toxin-antitoxin system RelE/ParE family toxin [Clostridiaceae bacterium]